MSVCHGDGLSRALNLRLSDSGLSWVFFRSFSGNFVGLTESKILRLVQFPHQKIVIIR